MDKNLNAPFEGEKITDTFFEGERPLYGAGNLLIENVKIFPGESALKESRNITARNCRFMGKYPFWHTDDALIEDCLFTKYRSGKSFGAEKVSAIQIAGLAVILSSVLLVSRKKKAPDALSGGGKKYQAPGGES